MHYTYIQNSMWYFYGAAIHTILFYDCCTVKRFFPAVVNDEMDSSSTIEPISKAQVHDDVLACYIITLFFFLINLSFSKTYFESSPNKKLQPKIGHRLSAREVGTEFLHDRATRVGAEPLLTWRPSQSPSTWQGSQRQGGWH